MIYSYFCPDCRSHIERDVSVRLRNKQRCPCGRSSYLRRDYKFAVIIPMHMKATGDDVIRQIMPGEQEAAEEGKDVREVRREWLRNAQDAGATPRYRQDLEG